MAGVADPSLLMLSILRQLVPSMFGGQPGAAASPIAGGIPGIAPPAPPQQQTAPMPQQADSATFGGLAGPPKFQEPTGLMKSFLAPGTQGALGGLLGLVQGAQNNRHILPIVLSALAGTAQGYGGAEDQMRKETQQQFENTMKYGEYQQKAAIGMPMAQKVYDSNPLFKKHNITPDILAGYSREQIGQESDRITQQEMLAQDRATHEADTKEFHTEHEQDVARADVDREQAHADAIANAAATRGAAESNRSAMLEEKNTVTIQNPDGTYSRVIVKPGEHIPGTPLGVVPKPKAPTPDKPLTSMNIATMAKNLNPHPSVAHFDHFDPDTKKFHYSGYGIHYEVDMPSAGTSPSATTAPVAAPVGPKPPPKFNSDAANKIVNDMSTP